MHEASTDLPLLFEVKITPSGTDIELNRNVIFPLSRLKGTHFGVMEERLFSLFSRDGNEAAGSSVIQSRPPTIACFCIEIPA